MKNECKWLVVSTRRTCDLLERKQNMLQLMTFETCRMTAVLEEDSRDN